MLASNKTQMVLFTITAAAYNGNSAAFSEIYPSTFRLI